MFNPLLWQFCKLFPYLECLHEISNKEIFFPDKYRMLFSSGDTAGRKVNSILGQKIMLQLENCLLWMSGNSRKGGGLEVLIGIFWPCVGDFCPAYPLISSITSQIFTFTLTWTHHWGLRPKTKKNEMHDSPTEVRLGWCCCSSVNQETLLLSHTLPNIDTVTSQLMV